MEAAFANQHDTSISITLYIFAILPASEDCKSALDPCDFLNARGKQNP